MVKYVEEDDGQYNIICYNTALELASYKTNKQTYFKTQDTEKEGRRIKYRLMVSRRRGQTLQMTK